MPKDTENRKEIIDKARDIKEKVKAKLTEKFVQEIDQNFTLEQLLEELNIDMKD